MWGRPNKAHAVVFASLSKRWILRQEAVAWVNGVGIRGGSNSHEVCDVQVGVYRALSTTDEIAHIRRKPVASEGILRRIDSNGTDTELSGRTQDAERDFAAIRDE